jgi:GT2 family glycosyltransferase
MKRLTHEVIICTRNRREDLEEALSSLRQQSRQPELVTIVDSSDASESQELIGRIQGEVGFQLRYCRSLPGLPLQRNVGIRMSRGDVLHFIDDDVILDPGYLAALAKSFEDSDDALTGAGGLIVNQEPRSPRWWWRLALLDSKRQGVVLPSGVNIMVSSASSGFDVEWLSGCSMSYRRSTFDTVKFDESLAGYALMEDVDFSLRASKLGRLALVPSALLVHKVSQVGRWDQEQRTRTAIYRRAWFVKKNLPMRNRVAFIWSVAAGIFLNTVIGIGTLSRWRLRVAGWQLLGLVDFQRGKR